MAESPPMIQLCNLVMAAVGYRQRDFGGILQLVLPTRT
jgi:hypothetical protein